jgi:VWFA-related protein
MTRTVIGLAVLLVVASPAAIATESQDKPKPAGEIQATFRSQVSAVAIDVSVRNRNNPVTDLKAEDFELTDNGVVQTVQSVSLEAIPLDVTMVVDGSGSMIRMANVLHATATAIAAMLTSTDRLRLLCFGTGVREVLPWQPARDAIRLRPLPYLGASSVQDALVLGMIHQTGPDRRHLVVMFTDGYDNTSVLSGDQVARLAAYSDASVHLIRQAHNDSLAVAPGWSGGEVATLEQAVTATGGRTYTTRSSSMPEAFEAVLADYRSRYLLRYTPTNVPAGGWHDVTVRVPRVPRYTIHARRGYFG